MLAEESFQHLSSASIFTLASAGKRDDASRQRLAFERDTSPRPGDDRGFFSRLFETIEDAKQEAQKAIQNVEPGKNAPKSVPDTAPEFN